MKLKRTRFRIVVEYAAIRGVTALMSCLPYDVSLMVCRFIALAHYIVDVRHRRRTLANLEMTMGLRGIKAHNFALKVYFHLAEVLAETVYLMPRLTPENFRRYIDVIGEEHVLEAFSHGKGGIITGGHIGNWELMGIMTSIFCGRLYSLARPTGNQSLDDLVRNMRTRFGQEILPKKGGMKSLIHALRDGYGVGILMDQDGRRRGVVMPFMNLPASTLTTSARLSWQTGAPIVIGCVHRTGRLRYRLVYHPPIFVEKKGDRTAVTIEQTRKLNRILEDFIREYPAQWLWPHRRWKTGLNVANNPEVWTRKSHNATVNM